MTVHSLFEKPAGDARSTRLKTMINQQDPWNVVSGLRKEGRVNDALNVLRDALRRERLDAEGIDRAGRLLRKAIASGGGGIEADDRIDFGTMHHLLARSLVDGGRLGKGLGRACCRRGIRQRSPNLAQLEPGESRPDAMAHLPWNARLLGGAATVEDEVAFWEQAWNMVGAAWFSAAPSRLRLGRSRRFGTLRRGFERRSGRSRSRSTRPCASGFLKGRTSSISNRSQAPSVETRFMTCAGITGRSSL